MWLLGGETAEKVRAIHTAGVPDALPLSLLVYGALNSHYEGLTLCPRETGTASDRAMAAALTMPLGPAKMETV